MTILDSSNQPMTPPVEWFQRALPTLAVVALLGLAAGMGWLSSRPAIEGGVRGPSGTQLPMPVRPAISGSLIDHSVVESIKGSDEPDMTGASIGAYGP